MKLGVQRLATVSLPSECRASRSQGVCGAALPIIPAFQHPSIPPFHFHYIHDIPKSSGRDNTDTVAACREHHEEKKDTKQFSSRLLQEYLEILRGLRALRGAKLRNGFVPSCFPNSNPRPWEFEIVDAPS